MKFKRNSKLDSKVEKTLTALIKLTLSENNKIGESEITAQINEEISRFFRKGIHIV